MFTTYFYVILVIIPACLRAVPLLNCLLKPLQDATWWCNGCTALNESQSEGNKTTIRLTTMFHIVSVLVQSSVMTNIFEHWHSRYVFHTHYGYSLTRPCYCTAVCVPTYKHGRRIDLLTKSIHLSCKRWHNVPLWLVSNRNWSMHSAPWPVCLTKRCISRRYSTLNRINWVC